MPESSNQIRIAHAGGILLLTQIMGLFTGLLFIVLVIRNLSLGDFGIWQLTGSIVGISAFPSAVIATWSIRDTARGEPVGRTAIIAGALTIPLSSLILWFIVIGVGTRIEEILTVLLFALFYLSTLTIFESVKGAVQGSNPSLGGYSTIPFELVKVGMAYYLVVVAKWGVHGAIAALGIAYFAQNAFLIYSIRKSFEAKFNLQKVRKWFNASWVPTLQMVVSRIWLADTVVVGFLLANPEPIGLLQGARVFAAIIAYSEIFPKILYPKLIRDRKSADITVASRLQVLFAMPIAVGGFVLAEDLLHVLGPQYLSAVPVLRLLAIFVVIEGFEHLMGFVLQGTDTRDFSLAGASFSNLRSSWLVKLPILELLKSILYFTMLAILLLAFAHGANTQAVVLLWALAYGLAVIPFAAIKALYARKIISLSLPIKETILYIICALVMGGVLYVIKPSETATQLGTVEALVRLLIPVFVGGGIYLGLVLLLDSYSRRSIRNFVQRQR